MGADKSAKAKIVGAYTFWLFFWDKVLTRGLS